jgi:CcmD family protein
MDERNFTYMFYGFSAAWLIVVVYVASLVARERRIDRELTNLKRMIEGREGQAR